MEKIAVSNGRVDHKEGANGVQKMASRQEIMTSFAAATREQFSMHSYLACVYSFASNGWKGNKKITR